MIGKEDLEDIVITIKENLNIPDFRFLIIEDFNGQKFTIVKLFISPEDIVSTEDIEYDFDIYNYIRKNPINDIDRFKAETIKELDTNTRRFKISYNTRILLNRSSQPKELEILINGLFPFGYELIKIVNLLSNGPRGGKIKGHPPVVQRYIEDGKETLFVYTPKKYELVLNDISMIRRGFERKNLRVYESIYKADRYKVANTYYKLEYEVTEYSDGTEIYIRQV